MKLFLLAIPLIAALSAQTPCIEDAKAGKIGSCLTYTVRVDETVVKFIPVDPVPGYTVEPTLPYSMKMEFSTKEQALAIVELVKRARPGAELVVTDTSANFSWPPFRMLFIGNAGAMTEPRIYSITGTIPSDNGPLQTSFEAGWMLNVHRLLYGGNWDVPAGYTFGNTRLVVVEQFGGAYPKWVGNPQ